MDEYGPGSYAWINMRPPGNNGSCSSKTRILLVDDNANIMAALDRFFADLLGHRPYQLIHASTVQEALHHVETSEVNLIITELRLRDRSGLSLLVQAKAASPKTPIVVLTAYTDLVSREDLELLGVKWYFRKPIELPELQEAISQILQINGGR